VSLPIVQKIANDKRLYTLVSLFLNAPAHLYSIHAWWQYPLDHQHKPSNAQLWHRDRDDFNLIKLFLYCTDVDDEAGPHAFIPGSHDPEVLPNLFTESINNTTINGSKHTFLSDKDIDNLGFRGTKKVWLGKAGTCFLEDTKGLHRAYPPKNKPRLIFSICWTLGDGYNSNIPMPKNN
jgi:Phytanoyl-CoA dioxygenase (PhyH).